ncbi:MAG: putative spermidine/putrescine transport system permease protein [Frankiales bacterium]|nr:putative spermidine/putrescine transport system permease protein [Frankiales bacterium]
MVALSEVTVQGKQRRAGRGRPALWRWAILLVAGVYFLLPLVAAAKFALTSATNTFTWDAVTGITKVTGFSDAFTLSVKLAVVTTVITLVLMVPTAIYVHLRAPQLRRILEAVTILPIVIPPVVLIVGVLQVAPSYLKSTSYLLALEYAVLAMPFAYRALDAGLRAIDLQTIVEASRSLGGGWLSTMWRVVLPNLRTALLSATVLTVALVLGEYTMASLDQYESLPVWVVNSDQDNGKVSVAVSLMALVLTWLVLVAISFLGRRSSKTASGGN